MTLWRILFRIPWHILMIAAVRVVVGALALYSASEGSWQPWAGRHALRGAVGVGVVLLMAFIDFKLLHRFSYILLIAALIVLAGLLCWIACINSRDCALSALFCCLGGFSIPRAPQQQYQNQNPPI